MSNVLPLVRQPGPGPAPDPRPLRRLRLYSRLLALLLAAIAALFTIAAAAVLLAMLAYDGPLLQIGPASMLIGDEAAPPGYVPFGSLPLLQRLVYIGVGVARTAPEVLILVRLRTLFALYSRGVVFARANAECIRDVGLCLVLDATLPFACHLLLSATGNEIDRVWFHFASLQELVLGVLVSVIASVMQVGREIEEERSQFV